jgi:hypothetical protein
MGLTQKLGTIPLAILTDSSNNVGIGGAANASFKLQVTGATNLTGALSGTSATFSSSVTASGGKSQFVADGGASSGAGIALNTGLSGSDRRNWFIGTEENVAGDFVIKSSNSAGASGLSGTTRLAILSGGNVGIGSTDPSAKLDINGGGGTLAGTAAIVLRDTNSGSSRRWSISNGAGGNAVDQIGKLIIGVGVGSNSADPMAGTNVMTMTSGNLVGIGTSSPTFALDVASTSADTFRINRTGVAGTGSASSMSFQVTQSNLQSATLGSISAEFMSNWGGDLRFYTKPANGTPNDSVTERMRITSGGSVCINATSPGSNSPYLYNYNGDGSRFNAAFEVSVATDGFTSIMFRNPNGNVGNIAINTSSVSYNTTSDYRLKEDLKDFSGLNKVSAIKVYDYKWKSCDERMDGVLAHELAEVIPYAVHGKKDGEEMQGVDYSKIVPILIKSIQEQQAQIEELKGEIDILKAK